MRLSLQSIMRARVVRRDLKHEAKQGLDMFTDCCSSGGMCQTRFKRVFVLPGRRLVLTSASLPRMRLRPMFLQTGMPLMT